MQYSRAFMREVSLDSDILRGGVPVEGTRDGGHGTGTLFGTLGSELPGDKELGEWPPRVPAPVGAWILVATLVSSDFVSVFLS